MKSEIASHGRQAYLPPCIDIVRLHSFQSLMVGSIESQDPGFVGVGDVILGDEENVWE